MKRRKLASACFDCCLCQGHPHSSLWQGTWLKFPILFGFSTLLEQPCGTLSKMPASADLPSQWSENPPNFQILITPLSVPVALGMIAASFTFYLCTNSCLFRTLLRAQSISSITLSVKITDVVCVLLTGNRLIESQSLSYVLQFYMTCPPLYFSSPHSL